MPARPACRSGRSRCAHAPLARALAEQVRAATGRRRRRRSRRSSTRTTKRGDRNPSPSRRRWPNALQRGAARRPEGQRRPAARQRGRASRSVVATGDAPPILQVCRRALRHRRGKRAGAVLPVTLRHVQGERCARGNGEGQRRRVRRRLDTMLRCWPGMPGAQTPRETPPEREGLEPAHGRVVRGGEERDARGVCSSAASKYIATRGVSLLATDTQAQRLELPQLAGGDPRPFEVVGIRSRGRASTWSRSNRAASAR